MKILLTISATVLLIAVLFCEANSQNSDFSVLAVKGIVQLQTTGAWSKILTGDNLPATGKIKLAAKSYIGLVFKNGNTVEINKPGEYSLSELATKMKSAKGALSKKLADYVMNEISGSKDMLASENYRANMGTLGSVERSVEIDLLSKSKRIPIRAPFKTDILQDNTTLNWVKTEGVDKYKVQVTDLFNSVYTVETSDTSITLSASKAKLDKNIYYFWTVCDASNPDVKSEESCIRFLSEKEAKEVNNQLEALVKDIDNNSALGKIIKAAFYENNDLIVEARQQYLQAINMEPQVDEYKLLYMRFLKRTKLYH